MFERAREVPGFVALHRVDVPGGREPAIAYFETEEHMRAWYDDPEHRAGETLGRREILEDYTIEILEMTRSCTKASSTFEPCADDQRAAEELLSGLRAKS